MRGLRIALLVALAGCAGGTNEAAPASTVAPSTTATITPSTTSTTAPAGSTTITPTTTVATTASNSTAPPTVPELLDFTATLSDGSTFVGADLAGTDVLFWFWAPT